MNLSKVLKLITLVNMYKNSKSHKQIYQKNHFVT